jgi:hypothetical protein
MKRIYRIYVVGSIPSDIKERVAAIHATGILSEKNQNAPVHTRKKKDKNGLGRKYRIMHLSKKFISVL